MKTLFYLLTAAILMAPGCSKSDPKPEPEPQPVKVVSVAITPTTLDLQVGKSAPVTANILPVDAADKTVEWSSDNPTVATVDEAGNVTGVAVGTTTVRITTNDGRKTAACTVMVSPEIDPENVLTMIPDPVFREYCTEQLTINDWDKNDDGKLSPQEAAAVNYIIVSANYRPGVPPVPLGEILSLKGIEHFTGLTYLSCDANQITSLDLSKNTALEELQCDVNPLGELDVSMLTELTRLECSWTSIRTLDVSANTALTKLNCGANELTSLDLSKNTALTSLQCGVNPLDELDVSMLTALTLLECSLTSIRTLDVSANTALEQLGCGSCELSTIDISNNRALTYFSCGGNIVDSAGSFPVKAWFDNNSIPTNNFTRSWTLFATVDSPEVTYTVDYQKVN